MTRKNNESDAPHEDWKSIHEKLGCFGCKYADETQVGIEGCCTYAFKLDIDKDGHCHTRKPENTHDEPPGCRSCPPDSSKPAGRAS